MVAFDNIKIRLYVALAFAGLLPLLVVGQLVYINVSQSEELQDVGISQASTTVSIPALRGAIYDREGRELVINTATYELALDPTVDGFTTTERSRFFENLSLLTKRPASYFENKVANRVSPKYVPLLKGLTESDREVIEQWKIPGAILVRTYARRYNYGGIASHVVGYVDKDGMGIDGLELYYQDYLKGTPGHRAVQRDRTGEIKAYVAGRTVEPVDGQDLILTIDLELQAIMEDELLAGIEETEAEWGSAIAMNPYTGEILGMANVPTYDPNRFYEFPGASRRNRAITDRIEPGSTFKLITAVAAIETEASTLRDSIATGNGFAIIGGRGMKDMHGYGDITFAEAIIKSSNLGIAKTALKLDRGIFYQYARNLGFGQKTWIDLPGEVDGTLRKPREWSGRSQASLSIGYEVDVTALQMLSAYSALANGGLLVKPFVVSERRSSSGQTLWRASRDSIRRAIKHETTRTLLPAFVEVVETGTAKLAKIPGVRIAGKTGTARVIVDGAYDSNLHRASFVGFFPAENPQIALLILLARPKIDGTSGTLATPIFRQIASRWISANPENTPLITEVPAIKEKNLYVANTVGQPAAVAAARLRAAGLEVPSINLVEAFKPVVQQVRGDKYDKNVKLTISTDTVSTTVMPDLTGLGVRQAVHWAHAVGLDVRIEGNGMVVSQTPRPGEPLTKTTVLRCQ